MAIQKQTIFKGVTADYWKIIWMATSFKDTQIRLALYKDKATRDLNINDYLDTKTYIFNGSELVREEIYALLKNLPEFKGAIDI